MRTPLANGTRPRSGSVLITVLLVLIIMTLAVSTFLVTAVEDAQTASLLIEREQRALERISMCELACHRLDQGRLPSQVVQPLEDLTHWKWTHRRIVQGGPVRQAGLLDESSKLNINSLVSPAGDVSAERQRLLPLPKMTPALADAILDWIDVDHTPRPLGAELSYYTSQGADVVPRNQPVQHLADLLHVRGITPELLWGTSEQPGLADFLTVDSAERIPSGGINLNQPDLVQLYDQLEQQLGTPSARFVVAYRLKGSLELARELAKQQTPAKQQLPEVFMPPEANSDEPRTRGGMDLNVTSTFRIRSLFDLLGTSVRIQIGEENLILDSPWRSDPASCEQAWKELDQGCVLTTEPIVRGRINLLTAPREVLLCLPDFPADLAVAISAARRPTEGVSPVWFYSHGVCTLEELRRWGGYITTQGSVFSGDLNFTPSAPQQTDESFLLDASRKHALWQRH